MRGRAGDAAVQLERADREVEHLGADLTDIEHLGSAVGGAFGQRGDHLRARHAHVAADGDALRLELFDERAPNGVGAVLVDLGRVDAANVIGLEHLGLEHELDASGESGAG